MGGTSTDISLVVDGRPSLSVNRRVAGQTISLNSLDIVSIGAGGGSIASVDAGGILHVGPASAGAEPGPACYGKGGSAATVTDANLVLGYLGPARFLGGRRQLDPAAAEIAVDAIAASLGIDRLSAARGIQRVINTTMAEGVRLVSVRRRVDDPLNAARRTQPVDTERSGDCIDRSFRGCRIEPPTPAEKASRIEIAQHRLASVTVAALPPFP